MTLPSYTVWFRGKPACPCLAEWLPWLEKVLLKRGVIKVCIDITQLIGGASASAGTHSKGGAFDIWQYDPVTVAVSRQMGADATWARTTGSFANMKHTHGVLTNCEHNEPARYQIDEVRNGGDGLVGSYPDPGPRPLSGRGWREGIEWAKKELGADKPPPKPEPKPDPKPAGKGPRIGYANIQSVPLMHLDKVREDVHDMAARCGILVGGEIQPPGYKQIFRDLPDHDTYHLDTEVPISVRRDIWDASELTGPEMGEIRDALKRVFGDDLGQYGIKVAGGHVQAHAGLKLTSPLRDITMLKVTNRKGRTFVIVGTHMVSGAHDGGEHDLNDDWRSEKWAQHFRVQQIVLRVLRRLGYTVIGVGDHNRRKMPKFLKAQKWIDRDGIDHIYWVPGDGPQLEAVFSVETVRLHSDHDGEIAEVGVEA